MRASRLRVPVPLGGPELRTVPRRRHLARFSAGPPPEDHQARRRPARGDGSHPRVAARRRARSRGALLGRGGPHRPHARQQLFRARVARPRHRQSLVHSLASEPLATHIH